jgi:5-formyltetrahydrofolate cyclo-ligase
VSHDAITKAKRALRRELRERAPVAGRDDARAVVAPLTAFVTERGARVVALFASRAIEIDVGPLDDALRAASIARVLPTMRGDDLVWRALPADVRAMDLPRDALGIPTPPDTFAETELARDACMIVPGMAFDTTGGRLGYGRGFYDRVLHPTRGRVDLERAVGLCLDAQLVASIPMASHDVRLTWLCTPARGVFRAQM